MFKSKQWYCRSRWERSEKVNFKLLQELKSKQEMIADQHDGSYELMRAIIEAYKDVDEAIMDYRDLNAVYLMSVGTFRHGVPVKKKVIDNTHLPETSKVKLKELLDDVYSRASKHLYSNSEHGDFGMFGTGFYSFEKKTDEKSTRAFIKMCIDISTMDDDEEMYVRAEQVLKRGFKGMKAASASMVLHCLKPNTFPILNSNSGSEDIFAALGIKLNRKSDLDTYIENCRAIKAFRDENLPFKNYRILDMAAWNLGKEKDPLSEIIMQYKADFANRDKEERYKWEAIKCFQDHWDIDAGNFTEMLDQALAKSDNLLTTGYSFAKGMIVELAKSDPDMVRKMFGDLYDENTDMIERIDAFIAQADELMGKIKNPDKKMNQHYQTDRVVCVYLFFRYPEKYYLFQFKKYKTFAEKIGYEMIITQGDKQNIAGYMDMCDLVLAKVMQDKELQNMSQARLDSNSYADPQFHMLTDDIIYFGSTFEGKESGHNEIDDEEVNPKMTEFSKNMILFGPPGTGKTYHSIIYAVAIIEDKPLNMVKAEKYAELLKRYNAYKDAGYIESTTFHQSFSYEEFIEGIKPVVHSDEDEMENPTNITYEIADGIFKAFCDKAAIETSVAGEISEKNTHRYVFIIDEINRGNISKIFGELITLIESTRRLGQLEATKAKLPYSQKLFGVPDNVYIIGTMNSADRSIALIDTALRRRFDFIECQPDLDVLAGINVEGISIRDLLYKLNRRIEVLCDREHIIGHSYFLPLKEHTTIEVLAEIFAHNIIPLLQEYFYEDYEKIRLVLGDANKNIDDQFIREKSSDYGDLFGGVDFDFDEIVSYEINPAAFKSVNAYKEI